MADETIGGIRTFLANPWVGGIGAVASIISIPLAVYLYFDSLQSPGLVYDVNPARATVVKQGQASQLAISYRGRPLTTDVTAAQIAIWNRGKAPVRRSAILEPIVIRMDGKAPILEATVRKTNRPVVKLELDTTRLGVGELGVSWNVLETDDGGVVQIVYAGGPDIAIRASGVVEGQRALREINYHRKLETPGEQLRARRLGTYVTLGFAAFALLAMAAGLVFSYRKKRRRISMIDLVFVAVLVALIASIGYEVATTDSPGPPFGYSEN